MIITAVSTITEVKVDALFYLLNKCDPLQYVCMVFKREATWESLCCKVKLKCHLLCSEAGGVDVADLHREWRSAIHQMGFSSKAATK